MCKKWREFIERQVYSVVFLKCRVYKRNGEKEELLLLSRTE